MQNDKEVSNRNILQAHNLPPSWVSVKLGDISEIKYGKGLSTKELKDNGYPVYGANGIIGFNDEYLFEDEQLLISCRGAKSGTINFSPKKCFITNNSLIVDFYVESKQLRKTLYFFLQAANKDRLVTGTAQPQVTINNAIELELPLPPVQEQHRIVAKIEALFSELDKGIESFKTSREQLKIYRQALLKHAFSGKLTEQWRAENANKLESAEALLQRIQTERQQRYQQQLKDWEANGKPGSKPKSPKTLPPLTAEELAELPELSEGWVWIKLGELTWSVKDGPHFSPKYADAGIPFISGGNVRPDGVDFENTKFITKELHDELCKRCKPELNDILYTKGGTTGIARVNTYDREFSVWVHVAVLKIVSSIKPFYLQHSLNSNFCYTQAQKYTHGVGNQDLGLTRMVNIVLAICPVEEQDEVVKIVDDKLSVCDQLDQTITAALQQAEALRQSILKKAFSGQLVPQDPNDEPASVLLERIRAEKDQADLQPARRRAKTA